MDIILSNDVKIIKKGEEVTISIPLYLSVNQLDTSSCFTTYSVNNVSLNSLSEESYNKTNFTQDHEPFPNLLPGTYEVDLKAYRMDSNVLIASGHTIVDIISIPSEVSTTCELSINLSDLSGATDFRVDYEVTGPITMSGSFAFTLEDIHSLLDLTTCTSLP